MRAGIYYNKNYISNNKFYLNKICDFLTRRAEGYKIVMSSDDLEGLDVLIVLGGDGTILTMASDCAMRGIPIMGINYGHMGFLAEFERDNLDSALEMLVTGNYKIQKRSMLKVEYQGNEFYALNDLVLQRSTNGNEFCNTINITAEIDGSTVDRFLSDGLIVSTPTGSTAYAMAAGGSVLTPDLEAFSLTPICAHSLHSRPIVFSDKSHLKLYSEDSHTVLNIVIDGIVREQTRGFEEIKVSKADIFVDFITSCKSDFFIKLLFKLNKWSK